MSYFAREEVARTLISLEQFSWNLLESPICLHVLKSAEVVCVVNKKLSINYVDSVTSSSKENANTVVVTLHVRQIKGVITSNF